MTTRTVTLNVTGTTAEAQAALAELGLVADDTSSRIGDHLSGAGEKAAGGISKLGQAIQNFTGIPVAGAADAISNKFSQLDTKGQKLNQTISTLGGVALGVGVVGLAAVGVESVKMADAFDVAQTQVQVAVKNSGESFSKEKPTIDATYASLSNLGFSSTDAATSLSALVTSTGNTKKAEEDLSVAADLARAKHISLEAATSILTKTLAGSTRGLTSLGLNLDIGSGKLATIAKDTTAYHDAQDALNLVNQKVADGTLTGAAAYAALLKAHQAVDKSSQKLQLDQGTIGQILDAVKQKTQGAASAFGDTLAGKEAVAGAKAEDLGISFGNFLVPKIVDAENVVVSIVGWFEKHEVAAEVLAGIIGGVLVGAIGVFTVNMVTGMIASATKALTSLGLLSADAEAAGASISTAGAQAGVASGELDTLGVSAQGAATKMEGAGAAAGEEEMAGGMAAGEGAAVGLDGVLGPLGITVGIVTGGAVLLGDALSKGTTGFQDAANAAAGMASSTLPDLTLKMSALQQAQENYSKALDDGGMKSAIARAALSQLGSQMETVRAQEDQLTSNQQILASQFGITKNQALEVAQALGINLTQALDPSEAKAFGQQIQQMGLQSDTAGSKISGMSANAVAALTALASKLKSTGTSADWGQLGQDIDFGIGNGITSNSGFVINSAQGMVQSVISASRTGLKAKSPSQVFVELGKNVAEGMALGVNANAEQAVAAASAMTSRMASVAAAPLTTITPGNAGGITTTAASGGGGGGMPDFVVNVNGMELLRVLGPDVRSWLLQHKRGTGSLGLG